MTTTMIYDALNRVTQRGYATSPADSTIADTSVETTVYDTCTNGKGKVCAASNGVGGRSYTYDSMGRVKTVQQTMAGAPGSPWNFGYDYTVTGQVERLTYPSGRQVQQGYDSADRLTSVVSGGISVGIAKYHAQGTPEELEYGNGVKETWTLSKRLQVESIAVAKGGSSLLTLGYGYGNGSNNNGNVQMQRIQAGGQTFEQSYGYDALNRLVTASETTTVGGAQGWTVGFQYDRYGNMAANNWTMSIPSAMATNLAQYNAVTNRRDRTTSGVVMSANPYDNAGYLKSDGTLGVMKYDQAGRLRETQVLGKTVRYEYDAEGRRVKRENVGQGTTYYVYDGGGELAAEYGAMEMMSCARCYLTGDMLGSTRLVTDEVGAVKQRTDYLPFGESVSVSATQGGGRQTITDGGGQTTYMLGGGPTQKFTGKERDAETGLDYFGARYMSAAQGRFTSPDKPFADQFPEDPQSWNLYVYGRNNPLLYIDPTGERVEIHGSTEEERQRALAALTGSLSKEAQSRVSIGSEKDKQGNTHYFAQISGDVGDFMRLGGQDSLENKFANLVNDAKTTEFALTNVDLSSFGGGVTAFPGESLQGNWSSSSNTRILVNPNQLSIADTRLRKTVFGVMQFEGNKEGWDIRPMTLGIATWHEFGHAWGSMHGRTGSRSNLEALGWENSARERAYGPLGPKNARRRNHP